MRSLVALSFAFFLAVSFAHQSLAQDFPPPQGGMYPNQSYYGDNESVNLATGNLTISLPLIKLPGRNGLNLDLTYTYNSQLWYIASQNVWINAHWETHYYWSYKLPWSHSDLPQVNRNVHTLMYDSGGGGTHVGSVYCDTNFRIDFSDGAVESFTGVQAYCYRITNTGTAPAPDYEAPTGNSQNGSHIDATGANPVAYLPNGEKVITSGIQDSNGNQITGFPRMDTVGRSIGFSGSANTATYSYRDSNGVQRSISVNSTPIDLIPGFPSQPFVNDGGVNDLPLITSIILPNGLTYTFHYNNVGEIDQITYPNGGYTRYDYAFASGTVREVIAKHVCRAVVVPAGTTIYTPLANTPTNTCSVSEDTTTYAPTLNGSTNGSIAVTDPLGNATSYEFVSGLKFESKRTISDASGHPLKSVQTEYTQKVGTAFCPFGLKSRETVTLDNVVVGKTEWDYAHYLDGTGCAPNPIEKREYTYTNPNFVLVRKTQTDWNKSTPNVPFGNRKTQERVYDGNNTLFAKTIVEYDNYTQGLSLSGTVQHDSAYIGSATLNRGNVTAVSRWRSTDGALLTTRNQYDDAGNIISTTDPLTHITQFSYDDSWGNSACAPTGGQAKAYLTKVTNAASQQTSATYNSCTGTIASTTDANLRPTTFSYDPLDRLVGTSLPDGGSASSCYSDIGGATCSQSGPPLQVVSTKEISATVDSVSTAVLDGLGRATQTQLNSDPDGPTFVDTTYDALGRVHSVSNPHRTGSATTDGTTTYQYDALGRTCVVVPPDGTAVPGTSCPSAAPARDIFTLYNVNTTTVTDQAGKSRKTQTDGLGRLTSVWEDPAGLNYQTLYTYNVLDNLTCVEQHGNVSGTGCSAPPGNDATSPWRVRRFAYNSLFQLLSATNPESGTVGYSYDASGNLLTKTAPAPNQTGTATVVTTYAYDVLNRLVQKSYNDGLTATVKYGYDGVSLTGCTTAPPALADSNPLGSRTAMCDASGGTSWKHDELGRTLQEKRKIGTAAAQSVIYTYNLDGSIKTLKYPSTATVKYTPGAAGRMLAAQDIANSINYVQNAHYAPFGGLTSMSQGAAPITTTNAYNNRLQPITISAAAPSATILSLSYDFHLNNGDNGNVFQIVNGRVPGRTQNFLYDSLNRIQQVYTNANSGQSSWGETFGPAATNPGVPPAIPGIDAWGNLTNRSGVTGKANTESQLNAAPASFKNQLNGNCHDAAGNLLLNTSNCPQGTFTPAYTYDAENRLLTAGGVTYTYDGDGKRVKKSSGTLYWTGMGSDTLAESDLTATMQKEYIYFNGQRVARRDVPGAPSTKFYFSNHLGSASVITDAVGTMSPQPLEESDYYPYGGEISVYNNDPNAYKFTGQERDPESSLDDFGARYYTSAPGRFMTPDDGSDQQVFDPQSWNLYSYVRNNPLNGIDPTGHCADFSDGASATEITKVEWIGGTSNSICDRSSDKRPNGSPLPSGHFCWQPRIDCVRVPWIWDIVDKFGDASGRIVTSLMLTNLRLTASGSKDPCATIVSALLEEDPLAPSADIKDFASNLLGATIDNHLDEYAPGDADRTTVSTTGRHIELWAPFASKASGELSGLFIGEGFHLYSNGGALDSQLDRLAPAQGYKGQRYSKFHGTVHAACDFQTN